LFEDEFVCIGELRVCIGELCVFLFFW